MRPLLITLLLALVGLAPAAVRAEGEAAGLFDIFRLLVDPLGDATPRVEPGWHPSAGLRVRQEVLDEIFYFDPAQQDRNWLRFRARAGLAFSWGKSHTLEARVCDEFRKILTPDTALNLDELVLDRLLYRYRPGFGIQLTLGRQDVIWDDGFLVLDGTPLDGSRSIFMNALRLSHEGADAGVQLGELLFAYNPERDELVLWDDDVERRLADADETAAALRLDLGASQKLSVIWKHEHDGDGARPDLDAWTLSWRGERRRGGLAVLGEMALQHQDWAGGGERPAESGLAWAGQLRLRRFLREGEHLDAGLFGYSGDDGERLPFRSPWGRWPKWSETLLYLMIPEEGVGAWADIAGPWLEYRRGGGRFDLRAGGLLALRPARDMEARGGLVKIRLGWKVAPGLTSHLLAERFWGDQKQESVVTPAWGSSASLPAFDGPMTFLRWQLNYELR